MKIFCVLVLSLGLICSLAFSWGSATHVYMYEQLKKMGAIPNTNAIYGVMAPDVFNYMFPQWALTDKLYDLTHHDFMEFWGAQNNQKDRSLGYGFVAHNDSWGMDSTAHHEARTLGSGNPGYVMQRAGWLYGLGVGAMLQSPPFNLSFSTAQEICHELIESAIDLMIKQVDPNLPAKLISAAAGTDKNFLDLLFQAYSPFLMNSPFSLDATSIRAIIGQNDAGFRYAINALGTALKKKYPQDINAVAEQLAGVAGAAFGVSVDTAQVAYLLTLAMSCCPDYLNEVNATVGFVANQLKSHNIVK